MSIVGILIVLLVLAAAFYLVSRYVPDPYRWIAMLVLAVITIIWVLRVLGMSGARV